MDVREFLRLKEDLENKKSSLARLQGKRDTLLQTLQEDYGCQDVAEARKLLTKKEKKLAGLERDYEAKMAEYKEVYGTRLAS